MDADKQMAEPVAERIESKVRADVPPITGSMRFAVYLHDGTTAQHLLES